MKQGDIYYVSLDSVVGHEQAKTHPCVIISTDVINDFAGTVTVAPLSTAKRKKPFLFHVVHNNTTIKLEQLRTVDKSRLLSRKETISFATKKRIKELLQIYFD